MFGARATDGEVSSDTWDALVLFFFCWIGLGWVGWSGRCWFFFCQGKMSTQSEREGEGDAAAAAMAFCSLDSAARPNSSFNLSVFFVFFFLYLDSPLHCPPVCRRLGRRLISLFPLFTFLYLLATLACFFVLYFYMVVVLASRG